MATRLASAVNNASKQVFLAILVCGALTVWLQTSCLLDLQDFQAQMRWERSLRGTMFKMFTNREILHLAGKEAYGSTKETSRHSGC